MPPGDIDAVILTHAHIDHSGYVLLLVRNGFKGPVYCSDGTAHLCTILLPDSGYLQEADAERANRYGYTRHKPQSRSKRRTTPSGRLNPSNPSISRHRAISAAG